MMWNTGMGTGVWGGGFSMILVGLFGLLVLIGTVLLVVWLIRSMGSGHGAGSGQAPTSGVDPAVSAARERYARGEISKEELEGILRTLQT